jgi:isocitrate dehydrogenase kinase/phosphatase
LGLYPEAVGKIEVDIRQLLGNFLMDRSIWIMMKSVYSELIQPRNDWEIAETFFNSVTRRIFFTVGVDPQIEFVNSEFNSPPFSFKNNLYRTYEHGKKSDDTVELLRDIFTDYNFGKIIVNFENAIAEASKRIHRQINRKSTIEKIDQIDMVCSIFYRNKGAYLLGRIKTTNDIFPFAIALNHPKEGIIIDAVLLDEDSLSILFSFTRSYFLIFSHRPYDLVRFLKSIMPHKRIAELYTSIGYNKHGKTELYREIVNFTQECGNEQFHISPGKPGMVMIVFNMALDDLVVKLIRDRFSSPKATTRKEVIDKYEMVFQHDRVGRLVEAHAFEYLKFDQCWFSNELIDELQNEAGRTVHVGENNIVIEHAYVERRVTPLDLYLRSNDDKFSSMAVVDYGNAIKDLAVSNIFPGDMLLKNFGVTRHGRVVFYDYDELCPLTSCQFRKIPPARYEEDELADEPWYTVGPDDVFPEEMKRFLGLPPDLKEIFMQHHADLFDVDFWLKAQDAIKVGTIIHIRPYPQENQLIDSYN